MRLHAPDDPIESHFPAHRRRRRRVRIEPRDGRDLRRARLHEDRNRVRREIRRVLIIRDDDRGARRRRPRIHAQKLIRLQPVADEVRIHAEIRATVELMPAESVVLEVSGYTEPIHDVAGLALNGSFTDIAKAVHFGVMSR